MDNPILWLIDYILSIYLWFIIASAIISLLITFNMLNRYNPIVQQIYVFLEGITEPAYRRIRRYVQPMGGIDLSPLILYVIVLFIQYTIRWAWVNSIGA